MSAQDQAPDGKAVPHGAVLNDKVAIVTGGGRGLGFAYARALASAGAAVVVNDADADVAGQAAAAITAAGGQAVAHAAVIGSAEVADALVARAVAEFGRLDILVTNAGILRDTVLWKMTDADFDDVINVHLRGTFTCVRAAAIRMREQVSAGHPAVGKLSAGQPGAGQPGAGQPGAGQPSGGRIICVGSPTGQVGNFGQTNYAAAKAGIVGMVRTWALELARAQITVNAIIPVAATAMTETAPFLKPYVDALRAGDPLPAYARRELSFGAPDDVAGLVVFLASPAAADITGQAIGLGGDRLALWSHPAEAVVAFADGGWTAESIAGQWPGTFAAHSQPVGQHFPEPY